MHLCIYASMYLCICVFVYLCIHAFMYACIYVCMHLCIFVLMHLHTDVLIYSYIHNSCIHAFMYSCTHVFTMIQSYAFLNQNVGASGPSDLNIGGDSILTFEQLVTNLCLVMSMCHVCTSLVVSFVIVWRQISKQT